VCQLLLRLGFETRVQEVIIQKRGVEKDQPQQDSSKAKRIKFARYDQ
jgi:hypothetical protein